MIRKSVLQEIYRFSAVAALMLVVVLLNIGCGSNESDSPAGETPGDNSKPIHAQTHRATAQLSEDGFSHQSHNSHLAQVICSYRPPRDPRQTSIPSHADRGMFL